MIDSPPQATRLQRLKQKLEEYTPSYFPVAWKMGITISLLVSLGTFLLGSILVNSQIESMQQQASSHAQIIANQLADSAREPLLAKDDLALGILVTDLTQGEDLKGAAIFDHEGKAVQKAGALPPGLFNPQSQPFVEWQAPNAHLASYSVPIKINKLVAGFVSVSLSQNDIIQAQQSTKETIIKATFLMTLLIIAATFLLTRWLARPIHDLVAATNAFASGNLTFRLKERRNDELGQLIDAYNKMATGLLEKDQVESVLARFVSPSVARKMMRDIDQVQLGGKEMQATILFADIVGFTHLSEQLPPDDLAQLLNDYFKAISCATDFYRGSIDKYVGDCAMVVFGAPEEDSEHLSHGLCCAFMVQELVEQLNQWRTKKGLITVDFRIGVNSGMVLAGNLGSTNRMQYTVVGDTVNLASRLSDLASPGEIILPSPLFANSNIASRMQFHDRGEMRIRGKDTNIMVSCLDGVHAQLSGPMKQRITQFIKALDGSDTYKNNVVTL